MSDPQMQLEANEQALVRRSPTDPAQAVAAGASSKRISNAMTVDVEDYFQVQAFADRISPQSWDDWECRVERNTETVLALFEEAGVTATFFTLGWVAERYGALIRRIVAGNHELASHGFSHVRADTQTPQEFRDDVRRTKLLLEDVGGVAVHGYRAATFSIGPSNLWAFDVLAEEGYRYSSSIYPIRHDYYGMPEASRVPFYPRGAAGTLEIPMTTVSVAGKNLPCSGGGYFRLLPYSFSRWQMRRVNRVEQRPCVFYFHPWEIDPGQPRQSGVPLKTRVRHYTNLDKMQGRLRRLLRDFEWDRMDRAFAVEADGSS